MLIKLSACSRPDQNAGRSHNAKIDKSMFVSVKCKKYLGKTLTIQNSILEDIKSRTKSGNACCHLVQNIQSSSLISKNMKIKTHRTIILHVLLYGCETWSLTLRQQCRLNLFENRLKPAKRTPPKTSHTKSPTNNELRTRRLTW